MANYESFAQFYDRVMPEPAEKIRMLRGLIRKHNRRAKSILELAVGTGSIIKGFERGFETHGLDISEAMLAVARRKLRRTTLYQGDMSSFEIGRRFDVILCIYDSINHLLDFSQWQGTFRCAHEHLNAGGIFIFDMNTIFKLRKLSKQPPYVKHFKKHFMLMEVFDTGRNRFNWNVQIFEHQGGNVYYCHEEDEFETAFPVSRVEREVKHHFKLLETCGGAERIYFVCRKR